VPEPASGDFAPLTKKQRRFPAGLIIAAVILFLQAAFFTFVGVVALLSLGVFSGTRAEEFIRQGTITSEGTMLIASILIIILGLLGLVVLVGLLMRQRWAWAAAMTWAAASLVIGLVYFFRGEPEYWTMLAAVVFMLTLNLASVIRVFAKPSSTPLGVADLRKEDVLSAPADTSDLDLLRTFEPVLRFTRGEHFYPTDVDRYVARSSLWMRQPDGKEQVLVKRGELDVDKLAEPHEFPFETVEFLRFNPTLSVSDGARVLSEVHRLRKQEGSTFHPGVGRLARVGFIPRVVDALFSLSLLARGRVPPVTAAAAELEYHRMLQEEQKYVYYGRVARRGGWTILQYWFFYCYNSWRSGYEGANDHEADWENILVFLYEEDDRLIPEWAGFASHDFHGDDLRRRWDDSGQLDLAHGHPVVWVGAGSHASYFQQGEYQTKIALPVPNWIRTLARGVSFFWTRILHQAARRGDGLRIPFVDYARGDGNVVGPGQEHEWEAVLIDETTPWVSRYRGLWGFFANDPTSGENAPAGPMYERSGETRLTWYDPLGFVGLDKEPPPPAARQLLGENITRIEERQEELDALIAAKLSETHVLSVEMRGMEGNFNLHGRYDRLGERVASLREDLQTIQQEHAENKAALEALRHKAANLDKGLDTDPRGHIKELAQPVPTTDLRFNRIAEAWGAVSLSLILLGVVAMLVLARGHIWIGLLVMAGAVLLLESVFRGRYVTTVTGVAAILAVLSALLLVIHYWLWLIVVVLAGLALFLLFQKLRELRN